MRLGLFLASVAALALSCSPARLRTGKPVQFGGGKMWAWTERDEAGRPTRIGVTMTAAVLSGLGDAYDEVELPLPGRDDIPPYEHAVVGWDPLGHNPPAYSVSHFDFLFYFVPAEEVGAVKPGLDSVPVPGQYRPPDYYGQLAEPAAGVHWGDTTAAEMHGAPFTATFVYGYHGGAMTFLEPMIASAFLAQSPTFSGPVKQPARIQRTGWYPASYSVKYNPSDSTIAIAMEGLTLRKAE